jgi:hypothetical protein
VRDRSFFPDYYWHGAAVIFDDDLFVDCCQVRDDGIVDDLMADLAGNVVVTLTDDECLSSCEQDRWQGLTWCECKIPQISLDDFETWPIVGLTVKWIPSGVGEGDG